MSGCLGTEQNVTYLLQPQSHDSSNALHCCCPLQRHNRSLSRQRRPQLQPLGFSPLLAP
jgi:hypothetical protein